MSYDEAHNAEEYDFMQDNIYKNVLVKVPFIIGDFIVQIDMESKIKLPEPSSEIKRIKKNVFLTQCRFILNTNKVFLKGFIRKNIEYATIDCVSKSAVCGEIKYVTVHIPFNCTAEVKSLKSIEVITTPPSSEISYIDEYNLGGDLKEQDLFSQQSFNEKVYCELEHSSIYGVNIIEDATPVEEHMNLHKFQSFIEKEVIYLKIKLLQKQEKECISYDNCCD